MRNLIEALRPSRETLLSQTLDAIRLTLMALAARERATRERDPKAAW